MKVSEALKILQQAPKDAPAFQVGLACGYTPLHVQTFLGAHLQQRLASRCVSVSTGLYGDLAGTLEAWKAADLHSALLRAALRGKQHPPDDVTSVVIRVEQPVSQAMEGVA